MKRGHRPQPPVRTARGQFERAVFASRQRPLSVCADSKFGRHSGSIFGRCQQPSLSCTLFCGNYFQELTVLFVDARKLSIQVIGAFFDLLRPRQRCGSAFI